MKAQRIHNRDKYKNRCRLICKIWGYDEKHANQMYSNRKECSCAQCANGRRANKGKERLTMQERRAKIEKE